MTPEDIAAHVDKRIDERMEHIAEVAAERAIQKVYAGIGKGVLKKAAWFIGVAIISILSWLAGAGALKP